MSLFTPVVELIQSKMIVLDTLAADLVFMWYSDYVIFHQAVFADLNPTLGSADDITTSSSNISTYPYKQPIAF